MFKKLSPNYQVFLLIFAGAFLGGAMGVFSKKAVRQIPPVPFAFLRMLTASLIMLPVFASGKLSLKKFLPAVPVSLLLSTNITLFAFGIERTSASTTQMLYTCMTLIVAVLSYFLLKEKIGAKKMMGVLIGLLGALIIVLLPVLQDKTQLSSDLTGNLIIIVAIFSASLYTVLSKSLQVSYTPLELTSFFILTSLLLTAVLLPFDFHANSSWWRGVGYSQLLEVLYVGAIGTVAYYFIYQQIIKLADPIAASMVLYLQAVFTILWAAWLLDERVTIGFAVGSCLVFGGVFLANQAKNKKLN